MSEDRKNAARFMGFAGAYDNARPAMPDYPVQVIRRYLGHEPGVVVDLGCGTGLSTQAWAGQCARAIGVDASPDMLKKAEAKQLDTTGKRAIGLCYIASDVAVGDTVTVDVRGRRLKAVIPSRHLKSLTPPFARPVLI